MSTTEKLTACRDCKHMGGKPTLELCRASPLPGNAGFDPIRGKRWRNFYFCETINEGHCPKFEEKSDAD